MKNYLFRNYLVLLGMLLTIAISNVSAQSTVHVFMRSAQNAECHMNINGGEDIDIRGPFKRNSPNIGEPIKIYHPAKKKVIINDEGKSLIEVHYFFKNPNNGEIREMAAEIQLNLSEGSVHYIKIGAKGQNDIQIRELNEKDGQKMLKDKKYIELSDIVL